MSSANVICRIDHPAIAKGTFASALLAQSQRPIHTYLPAQYERRYAYPLVVFFHSDGSNEEAAVAMAPQLSERNFIGVGLRGPRSLMNAEGVAGFGWEGATSDDLEEYVVRAVEETRRNYHVHTERIYFAGLGNGATAAFRAGFRMANRIAGIASLNGPYPTPEPGKPLFRLADIRKLKVLIGHNTTTTETPVGQAEKAYRLMYAAGANVRYQTYSSTQAISNEMLQDVNRWIIGNVDAETDRLILAK
ncbi:MAG: hypothetical protein U0798_04085 [Gemmataceae bacterium]